MIRMRLRAVLLVCLLAGISHAQRKSYEGYQLLRVVPSSSEQIDKLKELEENHVDIDFWTEPALNRNLDINVPPTLVEYVKTVFASVALIPETIHRDLEKLIQKNSASSPKVVFKSSEQWHGEVMQKIDNGEDVSTVSAVTFDIVGTFPRHDNVLSWLQDMASTFSTLASIEDIGRTYEGRTQRMIKIGGARRGASSKPIIWVDSAIHAREWLTVGTSVWIINKMLTSYNTDPVVKDLMDTYDWYFLPVANPDGYEYTHTSDRLWRKTRTPNSFSSCKGTDPNRNWDYKWMVSGSSSNPCSQTYGGSSAFSEPCTQNMRDAILRVANRVKLYMGVHSYSQMWLTPWAWGGGYPSDYAQLETVANNGNSALRAVHGKRFVVGTPPDILYPASGGAYDWAKAVAGIKYSYTFELRPDGNAWNGFVVSESEIQPSGEEIWASLARVAQDIKSG